uniref:Putative secreted protein n=1 Tax=Panstrongylus lignarius TaxID=156445 RepID=A0A224XUU1_9HEMI
MRVSQQIFLFFFVKMICCCHDFQLIFAKLPHGFKVLLAFVFPSPTSVLSCKSSSSLSVLSHLALSHHS